MNNTLLVMYLVTSIILIITPGPDMIFVLTNGITQGKKAGIYSALGVSFGLVIHSCLAAFGLGLLINQSQHLFVIIKTTGALYLVYLGIRSWFDTKNSITQKNNKVVNQNKIFINGVLSNITNPKIIIFFLAFLPQFVQTKIGHIPEQLLLLGIVFSLMTVFVLIVIGIMSSKFGNKIQENKFIKNKLAKISGSIYILLGIRLALLKKD